MSQITEIVGDTFVVYFKKLYFLSSVYFIPEHMNFLLCSFDSTVAEHHLARKKSGVT